MLLSVRVTVSAQTGARQVWRCARTDVLLSRNFESFASVQVAQRLTGGRDTRFLRDEIRQMERQLEQKDNKLLEQEKDMDREKKNNEKVRP